ncbi:DUF2884 family protein [Alteromonas sp. 76-1]|jgi:hypothetical protein|uniref:Secreted protein n=1 Tax=Alteromonas naphthalenivorans TaxID=715451 RepID=F5Z9C2_ALTNA|nr:MULTISPECIES: DUF2884 family protein [Alteromonas]AEF01690.1 hypothetical protein ambt_00655 [Alteromonas naphthalenivorans]VEL98468.1 DUF2884 family protein [Alteromonas sp. 76-1]
MKIKQLFPLALVTSSLLSVPAFAFETSCDIELDGHLQYYQGLITVDMQNGSTMSIDDTYHLVINGESVSLNNEQQQWVNTYYDRIDTAIPMTLNIASEGLEIASVAVSEVFGELLGGDNKLTEDFDTMFTSLNEKLATSFYDDSGNIKVDTAKFDEPGFFDESWEDEFEAQFESLISESMGRILIAVGTQMLWNGGDMEAFEEKMERFGETIEHRVESQAAALEEKGDALCEVLQEANYAENKMQTSIPGLGGLDLIDMRSGEMKM